MQLTKLWSCSLTFQADMLLNTLDQYSRTRVPGYTGYKPRAGPGATALQPAHGATKETTQGFINAEVG